MVIEAEGQGGRAKTLRTFLTFLFHSSPPTRTFAVFGHSPADTTTPVAMLTPCLCTRRAAVATVVVAASAADARAVEAIGGAGCYTRSDERVFVSPWMCQWSLLRESVGLALYA